MFQAFGVHGPELTPLAGAVMDVVLLTLVFAMLFNGTRSNKATVFALATLVFLIAAVRVLMQPIPNIQPVTVAVLLVGSQLGLRRGVAFAILVTLLSNMLIGDGWWTLFQASGWALVAVVGSRLDLNDGEGLNMIRLCQASVFSAFLFGVVASLSLVAPGMTVSAFALLLAQGLPFDLLHAIGNVAFALWMGPVLHRFLDDLESTDEVLQTVGDAHVIDG